MWVLQSITLSLRILVAVVFLSYGLSKLRHPSRFRAIIRQHRILADSLSSVVAVILPSVEIGLGFLFLFNMAPILVGLGICTALILCSAVLIRALLHPQLSVKDCGCSSTANGKSNTLGKALLRNAIILIMTAIVVGLTSMSRSTIPFVFLLAELAAFVVAVVTQIGVTQAPWFQQFRSQHASGESVVFLRSQTRSTAELEQGQLLPAPVRRGNRRSFLKWSVGVGIGVLVAALTDHQSQALAYAGCTCECYVDCYEIQDCSGCPIDGPVYEECDFFCCENADYCDSTLAFVGYAVCP